MANPPENPPSADYRFGPARRVKRRTDFLRIQNSGNKFQSRCFLLVVSPRGRQNDTNPQASEMRLGVTITTKVHKRAARRNRLRRRLRECFRTIRPQLLGPPMDLVIIARSGSVDMSFEQIRREFHYLLYQSKLLQGKRGKSKK